MFETDFFNKNYRNESNIRHEVKISKINNFYGFQHCFKFFMAVIVYSVKLLMSLTILTEEDWNMPIKSLQYLIIFFVSIVFIFNTL